MVAIGLTDRRPCLPLDPVALAFKRIGRQRHPPALFPAMEGCPVDLDSCKTQLAQALPNPRWVRLRFLWMTQARKHSIGPHLPTRQIAQAPPRPYLQQDLLLASGHFLEPFTKQIGR